MKIYHYTSIQALALIIKNQTILFNRLDNVDDLEESQYGSGPYNVKLAKYEFVSCWSKEPSENISLWKMYAGFGGVRIAMDEDLFVSYCLAPGSPFKSYYKQLFNIEKDYCATSVNNEVKLYDVTYCDDPENKIKELIKHTDNGGIVLNTSKIGFYKRKEWAFQKESRFKISIFPSDPYVFIKDPALTKSFMEGPIINGIIAYTESIRRSIDNNYDPKVQRIFMPIKKEALDSIEVMLGPCTTEADRIIVEALLQGHKDSKITDSYFRGKIRDKAN